MREVIESRFTGRPPLFPERDITTEQVVAQARTEYERLHDLPHSDPDERERYLSGACPGQPGGTAAEAGDGRMVCRLVLAHRRGIACGMSPRRLTFHRAVRTGGDDHRAVGIATSSSSIGNSSSPTCSRPSGAGSMP